MLDGGAYTGANPRGARTRTTTGGAPPGGALPILTAGVPNVLPIPAGFGTRRLKCVLGLKGYPELDADDWTGKVVFDFGPQGSVHVQPVPAPRAIRLPD